MTCTPFSSRLSDFDLHLLGEGRHYRLYDKLGAHPSADGTHFAVWAPNAAAVSVIGDFNDWRATAHPMRTLHGGGGVWEAFVPHCAAGQRYAFEIVSREGQRVVKADPVAFRSTAPPDTSSVVWDLDYQWEDAEWCRDRNARNALDRPLSIYELHLGSWQRASDAPDQLLSYRELAPRIAEHCQRMGFTHVELLPVMEHPFYGSWGYQVTGYFAATARYGTPQDLMYLIDYLHQHEIGVILDWVPAHFPADEHGLARFDGTHLFEHADPRQGFHPEWNTCIFNYGRHEVRAFLISSALFWLDRFHADGLRVDGVASMLYLDYARAPGEWIPNERGGRENLEAVAFLRQFNETVYSAYPDRQTMAEESTAWPGVSRPAYLGGLGFGMKWNLGWMHDTLDYFQRDPIHRGYHHTDLTFSLVYAFRENFVLPLSHDEVVHGKRSLLGRMPGDAWQRCANLRLLFGYMWAHPGKPLLFMGGEFGQEREWNHDAQLDWHLLDQPLHAGVRDWVADLNRCYVQTPALYRRDFDEEGFRWLEADDAEHSTLAFLRRGNEGEWLLVVCNNTPVVRENYRVGVPRAGFWAELLNSDASAYGGSGEGNLGGVTAAPLPAHGYFASLTLRLPPLSVLYLAPQGASR